MEVIILGLVERNESILLILLVQQWQLEMGVTSGPIAIMATVI